MQTCKNCGFSSTSRERFRNHKCNSNLIRVYNCTICHKILSDEKELLAHKDIHIIKCAKCGAQKPEYFVKVYRGDIEPYDWYEAQNWCLKCLKKQQTWEFYKDNLERGV